MSYQSLTTTAAAAHHRHEAETHAARSRAVRAAKATNPGGKGGSRRRALPELAGVLRRLAWSAGRSSSPATCAR